MEWSPLNFSRDLLQQFLKKIIKLCVTFFYHVIFDILLVIFVLFYNYFL